MTKAEIEYKIEHLKLLLDKPEEFQGVRTIKCILSLSSKNGSGSIKRTKLGTPIASTSEKLGLRWLTYTPDYNKGICSLDYYVVLANQLDKFLDLYGNEIGEVLLAVLNKIRRNIC